LEQDISLKVDYQVDNRLIAKFKQAERAILRTMKKRTNLLLQLILPALLSSGMFAQPTVHLIDLFLEIATSLSVEKPSPFSVVVNGNILFTDGFLAYTLSVLPR